jgi:hypothetical protein
MPATVPRNKDDRNIRNLTEEEFIGWLAEGRTDCLPASVLELGQVVDATTTNHRNECP